MVVTTEHTTDELHFLEVHVKLNQNLPCSACAARRRACRLRRRRRSVVVLLSSGSVGGSMAQEAVAGCTVV